MLYKLLIAFLLVSSAVLLPGSVFAASSKAPCVAPCTSVDPSTSKLRVHIDSPVHNYVSSQRSITIKGTYADDDYPQGIIPSSLDPDHVITVTKDAKGFVDPECCVLVRGNTSDDRAYGPMSEPCCGPTTKTSPGTWTVDINLSEGMNVITAIHRVAGSTEMASHSIRVNYYIPETYDRPLPPASAQLSHESTDGSSGGGGDNESSTPITKKKPGTVLGARTVGNVPAIVDRIFKSVFDQKITMSESTYWKHRFRTDKSTETKLLNTMKFYKAQSKTMPH